MDDNRFIMQFPWPMVPEKDVWLNNIVESLKEIASAEFQEKGWVRGEIHQYCNYVETSCGLFDDACFEDFLDFYAEKFGLSCQQIQILNRVREAMKNFSRSLQHHGYEDPQIIVNDPKWHEIRQLAKDALKTLGIENYLDPSKSFYRDCLLYRIDDIADQEQQRIWWVDKRGAGTNPFKTLMHDFFTTFKAGTLIEKHAEYQITDLQCLVLQSLYDALLAYQQGHDQEGDLQKILDDPEWHQIQALARDVLLAFKFKR